MSDKDKTYEISLARVLREELNHIRYATPLDTDSGSSQQSDEKLDTVFEDLHKANLAALCLSGGGIRSATFGLGIVQSLAKNGLLDKFDYLSTVSGGGYLGSWLSAWTRRELMRKVEKRVRKLESLEEKICSRLNQKNLSSSRRSELESLKKKISPLAEEQNPDLFEKYKKPRNDGIEEVQKKLSSQSIPNSTCPNPEPEQLQHLRRYSNYMSPNVGLLSADSWTLATIYTRNLLLNWTIFIPLAAAALLIPRILLALVNSTATRNLAGDLLLPIALVAGSVAVAFSVNKLPSKNTDTREVKHNTDAWVLGFGVVPLLVMAFAVTTFWAWYKQFGITFWASYKKFETTLELYLGITSRYPSEWLIETFSSYLGDAAATIIFTLLVFVVGYIIFHLTKRPWVRFDGKAAVAAFFSSIVGGFATFLVANYFFGDSFFKPDAGRLVLPLYVCIAVPVFLLAFSVTSIVYVGLSSVFVTDADREWLARQGAWISIVCAAWLVLNGLVLFGPIGLDTVSGSIKKVISGEKSFYFTDSLVPLIAAISGFLSLAGGFSAQSKVTGEPAKNRLSKFLAVAPQIAGVIFLAFLLVALSYVSGRVLLEVGTFLKPFEGNTKWLSFTGDASHLNILFESSLRYLFLSFAVLSAVGVVMACFINVNKFSFHGAYRDRLVRAYLGASHVPRKGNGFTNFDETDDFQMHRLKGQKPFHVVCAALNLIGGKNLAWQSRKAASFTMSPLHCGSWLLGYRATNEYSRNLKLPKCSHLRYCNKSGAACDSLEECELPGKALQLGTAMTISGAAANPNMGYYSSPIVTLLMSLFNIRLGWWLGSTGAAGDKSNWWKNYNWRWWENSNWKEKGNLRWWKRYKWRKEEKEKRKIYTKTSPSIAVFPLLNETFGRTDENKRYLNVTDGGHFENLGLYEMVLRRCRIIVLSDAAEDVDFTFGEIANAVEKCRVDLGVEIKFAGGINIYDRNKPQDVKADGARFAVAEITYPEKDADKVNLKGYLVYTRPTLCPDEPTEIEYYADANPKFPHQSTADFFYDEKQFEAYRALGFLTMEKIIGEHSPTNLDEFINGLRKIETRPSPSVQSQNSTVPHRFSKDAGDSFTEILGDKAFDRASLTDAQSK